MERFLASLAGRPELITGHSQVLFGGMRRLSEGSVINVKNRSHAVTAEVEVRPDRPAAGVIVAQGGAFGGWSLYVIDRRPRYCHNLAGLRQFVVEGTEPIPPGRHQVRLEFAADRVALGTGGVVRLFIDGHPAGEGRVDATVPMIYSGDETLDLGCDLGNPVSADYAAEGNAFTGRVHWVQIDIDPTDADHLVDPEERLRVIMARQ